MKASKWIILLNMLILFAVMSFEIMDKEKTLKEGELVLLKLAPRDPRSLMQGDYMVLRYYETRTAFSTGKFLGGVNKIELESNRGYLIATLDSNRVAHRVRFQTKPEPLYEGEYRIKYYKSNWASVSIGAESYFFEEGSAKKFEKARYGALRVHPSGESVLVGLYDDSFAFIEP